MTRSVNSEPAVSAAAYPRPEVPAVIQLVPPPRLAVEPGRKNPSATRVPLESNPRSRRLALRVVDLIAVALLIGIAILGARTLRLPVPVAPAGAGVLRIQMSHSPMPLSFRAGAQPETRWLACSPGSLEPFPAMTLLASPSRPAGCHRR